jgi:hypothetical protein
MPLPTLFPSTPGIGPPMTTMHRGFVATYILDAEEVVGVLVLSIPHLEGLGNLDHRIVSPKSTGVRCAVQTLRCISSGMGCEQKRDCMLRTGPSVGTNSSHGEV